MVVNPRYVEGGRSDSGLTPSCLTRELHHFRGTLIKLKTNLKQLNPNLNQRNAEYSIHVI